MRIVRVVSTLMGALAISAFMAAPANAAPYAPAPPDLTSN